MSSDLPDRHATLGAILGLLLAAFTAVGGVVQLIPPRPLGADAPLQRFSAQRAFSHVQALAGEPRPLGSAAHARGREHIVSVLEGLGLAPEIQTAQWIRQRQSHHLTVGRLHNVLARFPAAEESTTLLLTAHYDSVPTSPGAGDDASGVATLLEVARALSAGPQPVGDVRILITDGEELGLMGARAFVRDHPWLEDVDLVLNFDARGNSGLATMFETGPGSRGAVLAFAQTPWPFATSLSAEVYRRMPNDTDFSPFREHGIAGLNFAFIRGYAAYHSALDTPERLSLGTLQHEGSTALALVKAFQSGELDPQPADEPIYFSPWRWRLITYPRQWAVPLALLALVSLGVVLRLGIIRRLFSLREVLRGVLLLAITTAAGAALATGSWARLRGMLPEVAYAPHGVPYATAPYLAALALIALLGMSVVAPLTRRTRWAGLYAGVLVVWSLLTLVVSSALPGGSFLFLWPTLLGIGALAWTVLQGDSSALGLPTAAALAITFLYAPMAFLGAEGLTLRSALFPSVLIALGLSFLLPHVVLISRRVEWALPAVSLVAALGLLGWAGHGQAPSPEQPATDTLFYLLDRDAGEAQWLSLDESPDAWTRLALGDDPERGEAPTFLSSHPLPVLSAAAPPLSLPAPEVRQLVDTREEQLLGADGELRLSIRSSRGAPVLRITAGSLVPIRAVRVQGERIEVGDGEGTGEPVRLVVFGAPEEGLEVGFETTERHPIELTVADQSFGFPDLGSRGPGPRPQEVIPRPGWITDSTLVQRSFTY